MTVTTEIAKAVARMLQAQVAEPQAEFAWVPVIELAEAAETRIFVVPGDITSTVINRRGDREFQRAVSIAIIRACPPSDAALITELIGLCTAVGDALAKNRPLDEADEPIGVACQEVNHEPLYSVDKLREGLFMGVITARYTP